MLCLPIALFWKVDSPAIVVSLRSSRLICKIPLHFSQSHGICLFVWHCLWASLVRLVDLSVFWTNIYLSDAPCNWSGILFICWLHFKYTKPFLDVDGQRQWLDAPPNIKWARSLPDRLSFLQLSIAFRIENRSMALWQLNLHTFGHNSCP